MLKHFPFSDPFRLLLLTNQPRLIEMIQSYFECWGEPRFQVIVSSDASSFEGVHCVLVDATTFPRSGEFFKNLTDHKPALPAIVFWDDTVMDQIPEIRQWKAPIFMEIDRLTDSMPELLASVKKLVAFS